MSIMTLETYESTYSNVCIVHDVRAVDSKIQNEAAFIIVLQIAQNLIRSQMKYCLLIITADSNMTRRVIVWVYETQQPFALQV